MLSTLLKLGLSGHDVKPHFVRSNANISYKIYIFFEENILVALDKNNLFSIVLRWGGGVTVRPAGSQPITAYSYYSLKPNFDQVNMVS